MQIVILWLFLTFKSIAYFRSEGLFMKINEWRIEATPGFRKGSIWCIPVQGEPSRNVTLGAITPSSVWRNIANDALLYKQKVNGNILKEKKECHSNQIHCQLIVNFFKWYYYYQKLNGNVLKEKVIPIKFIVG